MDKIQRFSANAVYAIEFAKYWHVMPIHDSGVPEGRRPGGHGPPVFGRSVISTTTRVADMANHKTTDPQIFWTFRRLSVQLLQKRSIML